MTNGFVRLGRSASRRRGAKNATAGRREAREERKGSQNETTWQGRDWRLTKSPRANFEERASNRKTQAQHSFSDRCDPALRSCRCSGPPSAARLTETLLRERGPQERDLPLLLRALGNVGKEGGETLFAARWVSISSSKTRGCSLVLFRPPSPTAHGRSSAKTPRPPGLALPSDGLEPALAESSIAALSPLQLLSRPPSSLASKRSYTCLSSGLLSLPRSLALRLRSRPPPPRCPFYFWLSSPSPSLPPCGTTHAQPSIPPPPSFSACSPTRLEQVHCPPPIPRILFQPHPSRLTSPSRFSLRPPTLPTSDQQEDGGCRRHLYLPT